MAGMAKLVKVACLLVAALLFFIGAFIDDPQAVLGIGFALLAIGLVAEELPGMKVSTGGMHRPGA
jgi:hypothetical protein